MGERDQAVLSQHDIEIQLASQPLVEAQGVIEKARARRIEVVRAGHLGITARVALPDVTPLEQRHPAYPVLASQVVGGGQTMATATNDDDVVGFFELGRAPRRSPVTVAT